MTHAAPSLQTVARELIERARLGDQNARALIIETVKAAKVSGNERARAAAAMIRTLLTATRPRLEHHPVVIGTEGRSVLGILREPSNPPDILLDALAELGAMAPTETLTCAAALVLSEHPFWSTSRLAEVASCLVDELRPAFEYGFKVAGHKDELLRIPPKSRSAAIAGYCLGDAKKLQGVVGGKVAPAILNRDVAWELGL